MLVQDLMHEIVRPNMNLEGKRGGFATTPTLVAYVPASKHTHAIV